MFRYVWAVCCTTVVNTALWVAEVKALRVAIKVGQSGYQSNAEEIDLGY